MKQLKMLILGAFLLVSYGSFSQNFGVKAGTNFSRFDPNLSTKFRLHNGVQFGSFFEKDISKKIFLNIGILFTQKGNKVDNVINKEPPLKSKLNYLELPLNLSYKIPLKSSKLFFQTGPYLAYALSGEQQLQDLVIDTSFGDGFGDFKRFDFGLGFGTGLEFNHLVFALNLETGLTDIQNVDNTTLKTITGSITISYVFRSNI